MERPGPKIPIKNARQKFSDFFLLAPTSRRLLHLSARLASSALADEPGAGVGDVGSNYPGTDLQSLSSASLVLEIK